MDNDITKCIARLKNGSASGPDQIPVLLIKKFHMQLIKPIKYIINLCFQTGEIPTNWKESIVTPIYKSGDKKMLTNYRPISVINNLAKIFEYCLKNRLTDFLEKYKLITNTQYGFRRGASTKDAILDLVRRVVDNLNENNKCLAVFLDLTKAFDTVDHNILQKRLEDMGIRGSGLKLFVNYLTDRRQRVRINNVVSNQLLITKGIPQGTVIGPILFLIYINSIVNTISNGSIISYADDTVLIFQGNSWDETYKKSENGVSRVQAWLNQSLLSLNAEKTKFMTFSLTTGDQPTKQTVFIHGSTCNKKIGCRCGVIKKVDCIKYLGVILDSHLRWTGHIDCLIKRLKRLIPGFYQLRDVLSKKNLHLTYNALAESILRYCVVVWGGAYNNTLKSLDVIQNTLLKILFKKDFLYPTTQLYFDLDVFNIRKLYTYECLIWIFGRQEIVTEGSLRHGYVTRWHHRQSIQVPFYRKSHLQRFVFYIGPKLYNMTPYSIKRLTCKTSITTQLRRFVNTNFHECEGLLT